MNLKGYIKLHRKILSWEWINHPPTLCLFVHFLLNAEYEPRQTGRRIIQPGQLEISRRGLMKETGLSEQQIKTALVHLQKTGEITLTAQKGRLSSLVTINNWSAYQIQPIDQPIYQPISEELESLKNQPVEHGQDNESNPFHNPLSSPFPDQPIFQPISQPISQPIKQPIFETPEALKNNALMDVEEKKQPISQPIKQPIKQPIFQPVYNTKEIKEVKKKRNIVCFGEFVKMTQAEYDKLVDRYGKPFTEKCIETLDNYKGSTGKKYKDDYRTILNWVWKRVRDDYPGLMKPQQPAATTNQPEIDPLEEWGGTL